MRDSEETRAGRRRILCVRDSVCATARHGLHEDYYDYYSDEGMFSRLARAARGPRFAFLSLRVLRVGATSSPLAICSSRRRSYSSSWSSGTLRQPASPDLSAAMSFLRAAGVFSLSKSGGPPSQPTNSTCACWKALTAE